MIQDILNKFNTENTNTLETDTLSIKDNALVVQNNSIQITNISMISKGSFTSPITFWDIVILVILFFVSFIPPFIGFLFFIGYAYLVYKRYQNHLKSKYFIVFNLGSSRNYNLYFESEEFRNTVYEVIMKSFSNRNQNIRIDIKNQEIQGDNYETGASHNTITGNHNIVDAKIGNENQITLSGDITNNSNIQNNTMDQIPWNEIIEQLKFIVESQDNKTDKAIYSELLEISEKKDEQKFKTFVNKMSSFFNTDYVKDTLTGILGNVISSMIIK